MIKKGVFNFRRFNFAFLHEPNSLYLKYLIALLVFVFVGFFTSRELAKLPVNELVKPEYDIINITKPTKEVAQTLRQLCYNCHSDETHYPAKAYYAPFHKKYIQPVTEGRSKLNFSKWASYSTEEQKILLLVAMEQMENGTMPLTGIFPQGDTLSQNVKNRLIQWFALEGEAGM